VEFTGKLAVRYEQVRKLGQGGMGEVLLARERSTGREVAVKTIVAGHFDSEEGRRRFLIEAEVTGSLSHDAIIRLLDRGEEESYLYMVLEFVSGGDLHQLLARERALAPQRFYDLAIPILDGVAHAHSKNVIHRDIKAANILLDAAGRPKIADFGLAKDLTNLGFKTATGVIMGTPGYMAPEQARGQRAERASDQYALAVLMFEMLAGRLPHVAEDPISVLMKVATEPPPPLADLRADCPPALAGAIHRALAKEPGQRWPSVASLRDEVARIQKESGTRWAPRGPPATIVGGAQTMVGALQTQAPGERPRVSGRMSQLPGARATARPSISVAVPPPARPWKRWAGSAAAAAGLLVAGALGATYFARQRPPPRSTAASASAAPEPATAAPSSAFLPPAGSDARPAPLDGPIAAFRLGVLERLKLLRRLPGISRSDPEIELYSQFSERLDPEGDDPFGHRHPPRPDACLKAAQASGILAALRHQATNGLVQTLALASKTLATHYDWEECMRVWGEVHEILNFQVFAQLHGLDPEANGADEAFACLFASRSGPMVLAGEAGGPSREVLVSRGTHTRRFYAVRHVQLEDLAAVKKDLGSGPPAGPADPVSIDFRKAVDAQRARMNPGPGRSGAYPRRPVLRPRLQGRLNPSPQLFDGVTGTGSATEHVIAREFVRDQQQGELAFFGVVKAVLVPVEIADPFPRAARAARREWKVAEVIVMMKASPRIHVDLAFRKNVPPLCFRVPPSLAAHGTRPGYDRAHGYTVAWTGPSNVILGEQSEPLTVTVHSYPGEGRFVPGSSKNPYDSWEAKIEGILIRLSKR
jgi:hypothetical protein